MATEVLLGAAFGGVAFTIPTSFWLQGTLFFFWVAAFTGASHCVAADGYYLLALDERQQAWFMGLRQVGDRLAAIVGQGVLVMVAGNLQVIFRGYTILVESHFLWSCRRVPRAMALALQGYALRTRRP